MRLAKLALSHVMTGVDSTILAATHLLRYPISTSSLL
ncbi:MAG: hypothetical protein JWN23_1199 [Rhodocyclales bacterium]|nr:hypothetical protein [Rhodocyclales bacterium]